MSLIKYLFYMIIIISLLSSNLRLNFILTKLFIKYQPLQIVFNNNSYSNHIKSFSFTFNFKIFFFTVLRPWNKTFGQNVERKIRTISVILNYICSLCILFHYIYTKVNVLHFKSKYKSNSTYININKHSNTFFSAICTK